MRVLKILLILFAVFVFGMSCYLLWLELTVELDFQQKVNYEAYISLGVSIVSSVLSVLYHIKSFRFYRNERHWNLDKKLKKIYYGGAFVFYALLLYIAGSLLYTIVVLAANVGGYGIREIAIVAFFLVPGVLGTLEVSLLIKRVKRLKREHELKEDISSIGEINEQI